jgi:hypothetical protein
MEAPSDTVYGFPFISPFALQYDDKVAWKFISLFFNTIVNVLDDIPDDSNSSLLSTAIGIPE